MKPGLRIWLTKLRQARRKAKATTPQPNRTDCDVSAVQTGFERIARAYLLRLGYRVESPTERALRLAQAQWVVAGIDLE